MRSSHLFLVSLCSALNTLHALVAPLFCLAHSYFNRCITCIVTLAKLLHA